MINDTLDTKASWGQKWPQTTTGSACHFPAICCHFTGSACQSSGSACQRPPQPIENKRCFLPYDISAQ